MTIGERIKTVRKARNMSQEEVAKFIGTTKQAIYKYENDIVTNIPLDKIDKLAVLFSTTPAYLMGWEEEKSNTLTEADLSESEMMLIELYRSMPKETQEIALKMLEAVVQGQKR